MTPVSEHTVTFQIRSISGLAQCFLCRAIVSFLIDGRKLERAAMPRCPACRAECEILEDSIHVDVQVQTASAP